MRARYNLQAGFTYIGLLIAVVIMGLMLTVAGRVWSVTEQRERETQLLFAGDAIRMAIAGYFAKQAGDKVKLVAFPPTPGVRFDYEISMGVRYGEGAWKTKIDQWIGWNQSCLSVGSFKKQG